MAKTAQPASFAGDVEVPTDLLAGLLMEQASARRTAARGPDRLPAKVVAVMAVTTLLTFATLSSGYQYLFPQQLFA
jgi:hypothetical protein